MKNFIEFLILWLMLMFAVFLFLTPAYTNDGMATDFFEYWTNDSYFEENFK